MLRDAEASLRGLMRRAIEDQRYPDVAAIAHLADSVAKLSCSGIDALPAPTTPMRTSPVVASAPVRSSGKKDFPRFHRDGDKIVKIGWSKKSKSEYEHRAPRSVADALLSSIRSKFRDGQQFAATDVIPLKSDEESIPDYQTYLALKWFHVEGVVTKHGRDRYAVEPGRVGPEGLEPIWSRLPTTRKGGAV